MLSNVWDKTIPRDLDYSSNPWTSCNSAHRSFCRKTGWTDSCLDRFLKTKKILWKNSLQWQNCRWYNSDSASKQKALSVARTNRWLWSRRIFFWKLIWWFAFQKIFFWSSSWDSHFKKWARTHNRSIMRLATKITILHL